MSSIDKRTLKAYVRYDGTGRIVPSSLILRKSKPKVGKWKEIDAYECCNAGNSYLLLESSNPPANEFLLQEDGSKIII